MLRQCLPVPEGMRLGPRSSSELWSLRCLDLAASISSAFTRASGCTRPPLDEATRLRSLFLGPWAEFSRLKPLILWLVRREAMGELCGSDNPSRTLQFSRVFNCDATQTAFSLSLPLPLLIRLLYQNLSLCLSNLVSVAVMLV